MAAELARGGGATAVRATAFKSRHPRLAYGVAVAAVAAAAGLQLALDPVWGAQLPFLIFYPAILVAAYVGGFWPGLLATGLSVVMAQVLEFEPLEAAFTGPAAKQLAWLMFIATGAMTSALTESLHRATAARLRADARGARAAERLELLYEIDRAIIGQETPRAVAEAALRRFQALLRVPRAMVNVFDLSAGEAETLAVVEGGELAPVPPGPFPLARMGDVEALRRGEVRVVDVVALAGLPGAQALLDLGVEAYTVVPLLSGEELIGALSFGGPPSVASADHQSIAQEVAAQLAIAIAQADLRQRVERHRDELEARVRERSAALDNAQAELLRRERLAVIGQLAASLSHELRHPLGVIKNAAYYLRMIVRGDERVRKHLAIIDAEIARGTGIVSALVDFARLTPSRPQAIDLRAVAREALDSVELTAGIVAGPELPEGLPPVSADRGQVLLVLGNVIRNAVQAMPLGGNLTVSAGCADGAVVVAVSDTGEGIAPEHLERVFEPFFSTRARGIGLGLAIAKVLTEQNGGAIGVETAAGLGTRVTVRFPRAAEASPSAQGSGSGA